MKVVAFCGSLRKASFNRGLIHSTMLLVKDSVKGMEIEYIDIASLSMLNTDLEVNETYPPIVEVFHQKILKADCYLFESPEYNYSGTLLIPLCLYYYFLQ
ncbi:hypothetical protein Patl1_03137 [Pistacia atlantica]|uniref:Uncharacterized protein n=1 Tax=Pistacia atlantica TaxID=434234 RepID=A0ACC1C981_9ROSI|nr:hypothetical protein Patl1_03137 [Pistacia atlantica]